MVENIILIDPYFILFPSKFLKHKSEYKFAVGHTIIMLSSGIIINTFKYT